jgi:hypothetical protein
MGKEGGPERSGASALSAGLAAIVDRDDLALHRGLVVPAHVASFPALAPYDILDTLPQKTEFEDFTWLASHIASRFAAN